MVSLENVEETMIAELGISRAEAKIFLLLLSNSKMSKANLSQATGLEIYPVDIALKSLIEKGSCIEIGGEYEALNPRFAITNMYRMMCHAKNQEVKRNKVVDQLATMLQKPYENARAK